MFQPFVQWSLLIVEDRGYAAEEKAEVFNMTISNSFFFAAEVVVKQCLVNTGLNRDMRVVTAANPLLVNSFRAVSLIFCSVEALSVRGCF